MPVAAILLQASAAIFAPPLDAPLRIVSERIQSGERQYRMERTIRFAREDAGYRAEVRMVTAVSTTPDSTGSLYEAGFAAFTGRTIVFHLDRAGAVRGVDDLPQLWEAFCARVAQSAARQRTLAPAARAALAQRIAAPLRAMPAERQRALLASLVTAFIAADAPEPGSQAVRMPGSSPFGGPVTLSGTKVTTAAGPLLETILIADAETALPAEGAAPARIAKIAFESRRRSDPRTGLVETLSETHRTIVGSGPERRTVERVTTTRVTMAEQAD